MIFQKQVDGLLTALGLKADASTLSTHVNDEANPHDVTKTQVGLGSVDNTADSAKPVSTAQQTALNLKANQVTTYTKTEVDTNIADLVDSAPGTLDTLNELAAALGDDPNFATTISGQIGLKANLTALSAHTDSRTNPHVVTKTQVGLGSVDNTSDANKPVSTAQAAAISSAVSGKANKDSGAEAGELFTATADGDLNASGKKINDAGTDTEAIWTAAKVAAAIAAGVSGVAVTGYQKIVAGPTTPTAVGAVNTITGFFTGKLPHESVKPILSINGIMIPESEVAIAANSNRWQRNGNDLKISVKYAINDDDEIVAVYSY